MPHTELRLGNFRQPDTVTVLRFDLSYGHRTVLLSIRTPMTFSRTVLHSRTARGGKNNVSTYSH